MKKASSVDRLESRCDVKKSWNYPNSSVFCYITDGEKIHKFPRIKNHYRQFWGEIGTNKRMWQQLRDNFLFFHKITLEKIESLTGGSDGTSAWGWRKKAILRIIIVVIMWLQVLFLYPSFAFVQASYLHSPLFLSHYSIRNKISVLNYWTREKKNQRRGIYT